MFMNLQDASLTINGYIAPCHCKCSHCLLCSGDNAISKVNFENLKKLALKFQGFEKTYGFYPQLCVYNCSEYENLPEAIQVNRQLSNPYAGFENMDGTKIREDSELEQWVNNLKEIGVTRVNFSWFGDRDFHDKFVHRKGDFDYLLSLSKAIAKVGLPRDNSVFLLRSNLEQMGPLTKKLKAIGSTPYYRLLDYRGNAKKMINEFIRERDLSKLPNDAKSKSLAGFKPEYQWIERIKAQQNPPFTKRGLFLVATPENIDQYMRMSVEEILNMFHDMDTRLQNAIPSIQFLAEKCGNENSDILFDYRSLIWKWSDMHFENNPNWDQSVLFSDLHTSVMWR